MVANKLEDLIGMSLFAEFTGGLEKSKIFFFSDIYIYSRIAIFKHTGLLISYSIYRLTIYISGVFSALTHDLI